MVIINLLNIQIVRRNNFNNIKMVTSAKIHCQVSLEGVHM